MPFAVPKFLIKQCYQKRDLAAHRSRAGMRGWGLGEGEVCGSRLLSRGQPGGKSFYRCREGLCAERAQAALTVILKLVTWSSDKHHLDCFKYSYSSVPELVCSHFSEASSWNCGSLCHGYSLVIMQLMSSTWWGFQSLQDSSQDMAQNITYSP